MYTKLPPLVQIEIRKLILPPQTHTEIVAHTIYVWENKGLRKKRKREEEKTDIDIRKEKRGSQSKGYTLIGAPTP